MKSTGLHPLSSDVEVLYEAMTSALAQTADEHSLLCVHVCDVSKVVADNLNVTLARLAQALGGPVTLAEIDPGEYVLFLASWPPVQARQAARLIRAVIQKEKDLHGESIRIGFLPIRGSVEDLEQLLKHAQQLCRDDCERAGSGKHVSILSLQPADSHGKSGPRDASEQNMNFTRQDTKGGTE